MEGVLLLKGERPLHEGRCSFIGLGCLAMNIEDTGTVYHISFQIALMIFLCIHPIDDMVRRATTQSVCLIAKKCKDHRIKGIVLSSDYLLFNDHTYNPCAVRDTQQRS